MSNKEKIEKLIESLESTLANEITSDICVRLEGFLYENADNIISVKNHEITIYINPYTVEITSYVLSSDGNKVLICAYNDTDVGVMSFHLYPTEKQTIKIHVAMQNLNSYHKAKKKYENMKKLKQLLGVG